MAGIANGAIMIAAIGLFLGAIVWLFSQLARWQRGRRFAKAVMVGSGCVMAIGVMVAGQLTSGSRTVAKSEKASTRVARNRCDSHAGAFIASKDHVRRRLKSPGSADFPFLDYRHRKMPGCRMFISSYVDAQNGFGALIRTNYAAVVEYRDDRWHLVSLRFQ